MFVSQALTPTRVTHQEPIEIGTSETVPGTAASVHTAVGFQQVCRVCENYSAAQSNTSPVPAV